MMRMRATLWQRPLGASASRLVLAGVTMLGMGLVPACGDDGGGSGGPDARVPGDGGGDGPDGPAAPDAGPDAALPDAMPPTRRAGTIVISELSVTADVAPELSGADIDIRYVDPDVATVPVFPAGATEPAVAAEPGQCLVWVYSESDSEVEPPVIDEGAVTIGGALSPIGTCAYDATRSGYACQFTTGTVPMNAVIIADQSAGTADMAWGRPEFMDKDVEGMFIELEGLTNGQNEGFFPIHDSDNNSLVIGNPNALFEVVASESSYRIFAGVGPTPAEKPFLGDGTTVVVGKAAGAQVAGFADITLAAAGEGMQLIGTSAELHALPDTAAELTFQCGAPGDDQCGATPAGATPMLLLTGRTTDASLDQAGPTDMPGPTSRYAVFECRGAEGEQAITLPLAAMQAILDTEPTRIETKLLRVVRTDDVEGDPARPGITTELLVGHGLVGYTDIASNE
jgi:hypothetical protein